MLVVERVPLHLLEQVAGVHHLEAEVARGREHRGRRIEDQVRALVVRERVAAGDDVGEAGPLADLLRGPYVEEPGQHVEALRARHLGDVLRDVDAPRVDAGLLQRREQHAVVAAELDHARRPEALAQPARRSPGSERPAPGIVLEENE